MYSTLCRPFLSSTIVLFLLLSPTSFAQTVKVERPPQYVLMAFDGSKEIQMWRDTREFARRMTEIGKPVKFTYFVSGVYWLTEANRDLYKGPNRRAGYSEIGFGKGKDDIIQRIDEVNAAVKEGHEMASHGNGHFDGSDSINRNKTSHRPWSQNDWTLEFNQFNDLIFGVFRNNNITERNRYLFAERDITGFRAPVLGVSEGLWPTLANFGFKYDTSKVNYAWYWPQKDKYGLWQFPLATIPVVGTAKKTLSMDYNFYVVQSKGVRDEANKELYKKQMFDSYMAYFEGNYYGKRAPIHIGHHFSRWNGGAYWEAMKDFAVAVCGLKEVKCVTYTEYVQFLEGKDAATLATYKSGSFDKLAGIKSVNAAILDLKLALSMNNSAVTAQASGADLKRLSLRPVLKVNGQLVRSKQIDMRSLRENFEGKDLNISAHVYDKKGVELQSATYQFQNIGTDEEEISVEPWEARALQGDLPEAHFEN